MRKPALLIVDVQHGIFQRNKPVYKSDKLLQNLNMLEHKARAQNALIVYIQHESSGFLKHETPGWKLHPGLNPESEDIFIRKKEGNSFFETPLDNELKSRNIDTVIVCGLLSQLCVQRTCFGAIERGYKTILVSNAHSNMAASPEKTIAKVHKTVEKTGVQIIRTEDIFL